MPPLYLDIVRGLARFRDVDLYALNPCREYWFDIVDAKRLSWLTAHGRAAHHESGNRLLAAWGEPTKAYLSLLFDDKGEAVVDESRFEPAPATTLLAATQNAILDLSDLAPGSVVLADGDRSLELHVCHSRTRELEVLHDRLLALFAADGTLKPADVLVVTPDLAKTAPLIDAVFGNALPPRHIPYAITGRPRSEENPVAGALLAALTLAPSRFAASEVFDLLQRPIVARRFGLDADALASVHRWIQVSGIRWGLDVNTRAALDLPEDGALHVRRRARPAVRGLRVASANSDALRRTPSGGRSRRLRSAGAGRVRALCQRAHAAARGCGAPTNACAMVRFAPRRAS